MARSGRRMQSPGRTLHSSNEAAGDVKELNEQLLPLHVQYIFMECACRLIAWWLYWPPGLRLPDPHVYALWP